MLFLWFRELIAEERKKHFQVAEKNRKNTHIAEIKQKKKFICLLDKGRLIRNALTSVSDILGH